MITFRPVVTYKRRDGTYAVRIRVTFARSSRYLATTLSVVPAQLTRSGRIKDGAVLQRAEDLIRKMREAVADLDPFALEERSVDWVCAYIRAKLRSASFFLDYFAFADSWLEGKLPSTAAVYRTSLTAFARYLGRRSCDINNIDGEMLRSFASSYDTPGTAERHLTRLATIFAAARKRYNDGEVVQIPREPFANLDLRLPAAQGQRPLSVEVMQRVISARPTDRRQAIALAVFVVSFGTMGANYADMYAAPALEGDRWIYHRQKTHNLRADHARAEVVIDPRLAWHIAQLQEGRTWWLGVLHRWGKDGGRNQVNRWLREWAEAEGLPPFSTYAARHSWATIARGPAGNEKATVDEGLVHKGDYALADIYAERDWGRINEANRRVLDLFSWGAGEP